MKKAVAIVLLLLWVCGAMCACNPSSSAYTRTIFAMDTVLSLTVYGDSRALDEMQRVVEQVETRFSATRADSLVGILNAQGHAELSAQDEDLLRRALAYCADTDGAFDITVYPLVRAWGFTTEAYRVPAAQELDQLLSYVGYQKVQLQDGKVALSLGTQVDLGGIAKGYCGELLRAKCAELGIESAVFNLGGNVQTVGAKPNGDRWRVAVQDAGGNGYCGVLQVADMAVVTSGAYERYFEQGGVRYGHIINPQSGYPVQSDLVSVTVVGQDGAMCDAYSTALFVMGLQAAKAFCRAHRVQAVLVDDLGTVWVSGELDFEVRGNYRKEVL